MIFGWILLGFLLLVVVLALGIIITGGTRAVKSYGAPTDETARIDKDSADLSARIDAQMEEDKAKVRNAKPDELLDVLRDLASRKRMRDRKK